MPNRHTPWTHTKSGYVMSSARVRLGKFDSPEVAEFVVGRVNALANVPDDRTRDWTDRGGVGKVMEQTAHGQSGVVVVMHGNAPVAIVPVVEGDHRAAQEIRLLAAKWQTDGAYSERLADILRSGGYEVAWFETVQLPRTP